MKTQESRVIGCLAVGARFGLRLSADSLLAMSRLFMKAFPKASRFLVDENLGRELAPTLRRLGYNVAWSDSGLAHYREFDLPQRTAFLIIP